MTRLLRDVMATLVPSAAGLVDQRCRVLLGTLATACCGVGVASPLGAQSALPPQIIHVGDLLRVTSEAAVLRTRCDPDADVRDTVPRRTQLEVVGTTAQWFRVRVFRTSEDGCVAADAVEPLPPAEPTGQAAIPQPAARRDAGTDRPAKLFVTGSGMADTNINHTPDGLGSYGVVVGAGVRYRSQPNDPSVQLAYEAALHRYGATNTWNRVSHYARADWERELSDVWQLDVVGELSLKGTSEDRELSDQYLVRPRLEYRLDRAHRVRGYAAYRLKRYDVEPGRNANNRYIGVDYVHITERGDRWNTGLRYEQNPTIEPRFSYNRWSYGTTYSVNVRPQDLLVVDVTYRFHSYPNRMVEVEDVDVPRRDHRWIPVVRWTHTVRPGLQFQSGYVFETRSSNDPRRGFNANAFHFGITREW